MVRLQVADTFSALLAATCDANDDLRTMSTFALAKLTDHCPANVTALPNTPGTSCLSATVQSFFVCCCWDDTVLWYPQGRLRSSQSVWGKRRSVLAPTRPSPSAIFPPSSHRPPSRSCAAQVEIPLPPPFFPLIFLTFLLTCIALPRYGMVSKGSVLTSGMVLPGLVRQLADIAMRPKHAPPVVATEEIPGARVSTRRFLARAVLCCAMPGVWRLLLTARGVLHQSTRRWSAPGCGFAWWRPSTSSLPASEVAAPHHPPPRSREASRLTC